MNSDPDSQSMLGQLLLIVVLTMFNAFFASAEMAFVSLNQSKVRQKAAQGDKQSAAVLRLLANSDNFLATIQVAITLAGFISSAIAATSFASLLEPFLTNIPGGKQLAVVVVTIILSYITLIFGELYPKQIALQKAEEVARFTAGPIRIVQIIFTPFIKLLSLSTSLLKKITPIDFSKKEEKMTRDEFRSYLENSQAKGAIDVEQFTMLKGVLSMDTKMAREIMVPRTDTFMIDYEDGTQFNIPLLLDCRYSRVPVYLADKDNIIGIVHVKNLLKASIDTKLADIDIKDVLNPPLYVPETIFMDDLLYELKRTRNQMAILNDEYGGVVGIATLEDLLEEIVGDIDDEYDETYSMIEVISETRFLVDGSTPLSKFNEFFNTTIESNDVDSIAGFFIMEYGNIPHEGEKGVVEYADYIFTSNDIEGSRLVNLFVDKVLDEITTD